MEGSDSYKMSLGETLYFIQEFIRHPKTTGAIAPTSSALSQEVISKIGLSDAKVIVEFGPGTGSATGKILRQKADDAIFFTIEKSPGMAQKLRNAFPHVDLIEGSAEEVPKLLVERTHLKADCIVSGLPWASFPFELQDRLLEATVEALKPGGAFTTFAYLQGLLLPSGNRFRKKLGTYFSKIERSKVIWGNLPPAFVYRCWK
jgi:phosphatidylethanolamine/phosphatidyl-N-methylethanolamine N-methyltransferase